MVENSPQFDHKLKRAENQRLSGTNQMSNIQNGTESLVLVQDFFCIYK